MGRDEHHITLTIRNIAGKTVAEPQASTDMLVIALLKTLNNDPMLSAKLLHGSRALSSTGTLGDANIDDGAELILILEKCWLHGGNVELEQNIAKRASLNLSGGIGEYSDAVLICPDDRRSFAVRLLQVSKEFQGALQMGFVSEQVMQAALDNTLPQDLNDSLCYMSNSGKLRSPDNERQLSANWTSQLRLGDIIRCSLADADEAATISEHQQLAIHVNGELRLDVTFSKLREETVYPAFNLYGQTLKIEFVSE